MADSQNNVVTLVGILAIVILVGLAIYFVMRQGDDSDFEVDVNGESGAVADDLRRAGSMPPVPGLAFRL